jgi:dienelactone hydrolase
MAIDYTGWGKSGGFVRMAEPVLTDDRLRFMPMTAKVRIKRTRLLPEKQLADIQNAISFLQGEPGVDGDRIGLWGNSFGGGHVIAVCSRDARVKAAVCQVPSIRGKDAPDQAFTLEGEALQDAIQLARTGKGGTFQTMGVTVDVETRQAVREYQPFKLLAGVNPEVPVLFITGSNDTVVNNAENAQPAAAQLKSQGNKVELVEIAGAGHEVGNGDAFDVAANAAAKWFQENL